MIYCGLSFRIQGKLSWNLVFAGPLSPNTKDIVPLHIKSGQSRLTILPKQQDGSLSLWRIGLVSNMKGESGQMAAPNTYIRGEAERPE